MILTILKSPLRSRQLLVIWLIFGVGLLPDKTEGLKCHSCKGDACKTDAGAECTSGFCEKITEGGTVEMKCSDAAKEAECIKTFPNGCYTVNDDNKEKLTTCMGTDPLGDNAQKSGITICSCNTDLCNKAEGAAGSKGSGSVNEKSGEGPSGGGSPTEANERSEGAQERALMKMVECYTCGFTKASCENPRKISCQGACSKVAGGDAMAKGCKTMNAAQYECYAKYSGGCAESEKQQSEGQMCFSKAGYLGREAEERGGESVSFCYCNTDLCNPGDRPIPSYKLASFFGLLTQLARLI